LLEVQALHQQVVLCLISADKALDYGVVMSVLAAVKQAGFSDVSLATNG